jgi:hypothetical protein
MQVLIQSIGSFSRIPASLEKNRITGFAKAYLMKVISPGIGGSKGTPASATKRAPPIKYLLATPLTPVLTS